MDLPLYKLTITEDGGGVDFVALVDDPAIGRNWLAFANDTPIKFEIQSEEQRIISGPLMIPDKAMFRKADGVRPDHYVLFDAETIKLCVLKFFRHGNTSNVNLMHEEQAQPDGVFMFESFLIDRNRGINPPEQFKDLPDGSWFGSYKVDNEKIWETFIKTGDFKGFSVEGFFHYPEVPDGDVQLLRAIEKILTE